MPPPSPPPWYSSLLCTHQTPVLEGCSCCAAMRQLQLSVSPPATSLADGIGPSLAGMPLACPEADESKCCSVCLGVMLAPVLTSCDHCFCRSCFTTLLKRYEIMVQLIRFLCCSLLCCPFCVFSFFFRFSRIYFLAHLVAHFSYRNGGTHAPCPLCRADCYRDELMEARPQIMNYFLKTSSIYELFLKTSRIFP